MNSDYACKLGSEGGYGAGFAADRGRIYRQALRPLLAQKSLRMCAVGVFGPSSFSSLLRDSSKPASSGGLRTSSEVLKKLPPEPRKIVGPGGR